MLIQQVSPGDPVSNLAVLGLMKYAPILKDAEFYQKSGAADSVKRAASGTTKTKITRSLNENDSATAGTRTYDPATKKIVSVEAKVDVVLQDRGEVPEDELAVQTSLECEEASWILQDMFFNGDSGTDAEDFDGMANLVQSGQTINTDTNGIQVPVGGDSVAGAQQTAIETLRQHMARVIGGASHIYMNEFLKIRWVTVAKKLGYYDRIQTIDGYIETIGGVIIRGAGYEKDGTPLLPFTETVGSNADCSSIYMVRWGERTNLTCLTSVGIKGRYVGQVGKFLTNSVDLDMTLHLQNYNALWKSQGWRL